MGRLRVVGAITRGKGVAMPCEESDGLIVARISGPVNSGDGLEDKTLDSEGVLVYRSGAQRVLL